MTDAERYRRWAKRNRRHLRAYNRLRYLLNPEAYKNRAKAWCRRNPEKVKARNRAFALRWAREHPIKVKIRRRKAVLKRKYGLSIEEYRQLLKQQRGRCVICKRKFFSTRRACVDHCHRTKQVRGLLCDQCNRGLVLFDLGLDRRALRYVETQR